MNDEDLRNLIRQVEKINAKVDSLTRQITNISQDVVLNANHGNRIYQEVNEIRSTLKTVASDVSSGQVKSIGYRIETLMRTVDGLDRKNIYA